jgi:hypothetical protein
MFVIDFLFFVKLFTNVSCGLLFERLKFLPESTELFIDSFFEATHYLYLPICLGWLSFEMTFFLWEKGFLWLTLELN